MRFKYLLFLIPFLCGATYYVDNTTGNNSNNGLTPSTAWKTWGAESAGDTVLLKKGEVWRKQLYPVNGTNDNHTRYSSYNAGYVNQNKPLLLGSVSRNNTTDWEDLGGNIWKDNNTVFTLGVGNIIFDGEESCGINLKNETGLDSQDDFYFNFTDKSLKVYSIENPATVHTIIECALHQNGVAGERNNVTIEGLDFRYWGRHGVGTGVRYNAIIRGNDFHYIGGADQYSNHTVRLGNAIEFYGECQNILIEQNNISQVYDAAITCQGNGTYDVHNVTWRNNRIDTSEYSIEHWYRGENTAVTNVSYDHNTCTRAGGGWGHLQRWDGVNGRHAMIGYNPAINTNVSIRDNIFDTSTETAIRIGVADKAKFIIDSNLYNVTTLAYMAANYTTLAQWQAASGQDANSISANPKLINGYLLDPTSPAIDAGVDVGVTEDYRGIKRPQGAGYDIGAIEFTRGFQIDGLNLTGVRVE